MHAHPDIFWKRVRELSPFSELFLIVSEMQKVKWKHFHDARCRTLSELDVMAAIP
jgi:hypothetical protein